MCNISHTREVESNCPSRIERATNPSPRWQGILFFFSPTYPGLYTKGELASIPFRWQSQKPTLLSGLKRTSRHRPVISRDVCDGDIEYGWGDACDDTLFELTIEYQGRMESKATRTRRRPLQREVVAKRAVLCKERQGGKNARFPAV